MILVLWLARALQFLCIVLDRAADRVYRVYFRHENRQALATERRQAIEDVIAETRPVSRVGSPINRER
jgi:hypothetical protein